MDFIERLFGISPDGGSGSFETMLLMVPIIAVVAYLAYKRSKQPRP